MPALRAPKPTACPACGSTDLTLHQPAAAWGGCVLSVVALSLSIDPAVFRFFDLPYTPSLWPFPALLASGLAVAAAFGRHRCRACGHRWRPAPGGPPGQGGPDLARLWRGTWPIVGPVVAVVATGFGFLLLAWLPPIRMVLAIPVVFGLPFSFSGHPVAFWATVGLVWGGATVAVLAFATWATGRITGSAGLARRVGSKYAAASGGILVLYLGAYAGLRAADRVHFHTSVEIGRGLAEGPYRVVTASIDGPILVELLFAPVADLEAGLFREDKTVRLDPTS